MLFRYVDAKYTQGSVGLKLVQLLLLHCIEVFVPVKITVLRFICKLYAFVL